MGRLDSLGFVWELVDDDMQCQAVEKESEAVQLKPNTWNKMFLQLAAYKEEHGDCRVPRDYAQNAELGKWVAKMQNQHQKQRRGEKSNMTERKKKRLDSLGFVWELVDDDMQCEAVEKESVDVHLKPNTWKNMEIAGCPGIMHKMQNWENGLPRCRINIRN